MGINVRFVPRLVENLQQIATLIGGVAQPSTTIVMDRIVEHTPDPKPPTTNLIDEAAMGLGERGELRGGTSIVDAITEYVGGGGEDIDNCVDHALHRAMSYPEDADVAIYVYGDGDDGHAVLMVDGQAYDPFDMQPIETPDEAPTGIVTRAQLEVMVEAGYDAVAANGATTASVANAIADAGRSAGVDGAALHATANSGGETYADAAAVQDAIDRGISLAGATFTFPVDGINFENADLTGATFEQGCTNCSFYDDDGNVATLDGVTFRGNVAGAKFGEASMVGARFEGDVTGCEFFRNPENGLYPGADLSGVQFLGNVSGSFFYNCNLTNAVFGGNVSGSQLVAANLDHTIFSGDVTRCLFEYARFTNTAFNGPNPIMDNDFFSAIGIETATFAAGGPDNRRNSFIGTALSPFPMIPELFLFGSGARIENDTRRSLEDLAASNQLFAEVNRLFPGAMNYALPNGWRSVLYDQLSMQMWAHDYAAQGDQYFYLKRFIFDATDERYTTATLPLYSTERPNPAPTLEYFYNLQYPAADGTMFYPFRDAIDQALLRMLRSDDPNAALDAPFGDRAPSFEAADYLNESADGLNLDPWLSAVETRQIQYNGVRYSQDQIPLNDAQREATRRELSGDELARFDAITADGIVTIRDLRDAGIDRALLALWVYCSTH